MVAVSLPSRALLEMGMSHALGSGSWVVLRKKRLWLRVMVAPSSETESTFTTGYPGCVTQPSMTVTRSTTPVSSVPSASPAACITSQRSSLSALPYEYWSKKARRPLLKVSSVRKPLSMRTRLPPFWYSGPPGSHSYSGLTTVWLTGVVDCQESSCMTYWRSVMIMRSKLS